MPQLRVRLACQAVTLVQARWSAPIVQPVRLMKTHRPQPRAQVVHSDIFRWNLPQPVCLVVPEHSLLKKALQSVPTALQASTSTQRGEGRKLNALAASSESTLAPSATMRRTTALHAMLVDTADMEAPLASVPATVPQGDTRQLRLQLVLEHRIVRRVTQGNTVPVGALPASARVIVRQAAMRSHTLERDLPPTIALLVSQEGLTNSVDLRTLMPASTALQADTWESLAVMMHRTASHVMLAGMALRAGPMVSVLALAHMDGMRLQQQQPGPTRATALHAMLVDTADMEAPLASVPATVPQGDTRQRRLQLVLEHRIVRRVTQGNSAMSLGFLTASSVRLVSMLLLQAVIMLMTVPHAVLAGLVVVGVHQVNVQAHVH
jgi:hypothetical protein